MLAGNNPQCKSIMDIEAFEKALYNTQDVNYCISIHGVSPQTVSDVCQRETCRVAD